MNMSDMVTSNGSTAPLSPLMLITQMLITWLFATGFVTYYQRGWHAAYEQFKDNKRVSYAIRGGMLVGAILIGMGMHLIGMTVFTNAIGLTFHNLGLFVLTMPLLDEGSSLFEYFTRIVAVLFVWVMHHEGYYSDPKFALSLLLLAVAVVLLRVDQSRIRYHIWQHVAMYSFVGVAFWALLPKYSAGLHMSPVIALQGLSMYVGMTVVTAYFIRTDHALRVESATNAKEAHFDALTNARSYAMYRQDITAKFAEAKANGTELALAVIDIDHFKQINDHYGHLAGDDILASVSALMQDALAQYPGDLALYRAGGEEFNVVFAGINAQAAEPIMRDCWRAVRTHHFQALDDEATATISVGIAEMHAGDKKFDNLYARADESLYMSKHDGRDTITINGHTLDVPKEQRVFATRTLFTQNIMDYSQTPPKLAHNEIVVARYEYGHERWNFPKQFELPVKVQLNYLADVLAVSPCARAMLNLSRNQFLHPTTVQQLATFRRTHPRLDVLVVEIMDLPDVALVRQMYAQYREAGVRIGIDSADPRQPLADVEPLFPYIDTIKFRINDLREAYTDAQVVKRMDMWAKATKGYDIDFVISEIENREEADYAMNTLHASYLQGYYFDRPELPRLS